MFDDYSQLLIDIQKKSKITVSKVRDIKLLKEELELITSHTIGYNTLRRLFGFLEQKKPSINTLNTLSTYLGFRNFSNYKSHQENFDEWYFQQNLQRLLTKKKVSIGDIEIINLGLQNKVNIVYLGYFLTYFIEKNNSKLLSFYFEHLCFDSVPASDMQKFSMLLSSGLLRSKEKTALTIYEDLIKFDSFRNNIPLLYIDYKNLHSRYFKVLLLIKNLAANSSDLFFVFLMGFYKNFYTEKFTQKLTLKKPIEFDDFYIALKGRYYGCCILNSDKISKELKKEIIKTCKLSNVSSFAIEIIPALLIKEKYDFLEELLTLFYEDLLDNTIWSSKTTNALNLIALANVNLNKKEYRIAKINLDLIELKKVELSYESYVSLFYFLTKLKISYFEEDKVENKTAFQAIKKIVKTNGFKKFCSVGNNYLLDRKYSQFIN